MVLSILQTTVAKFNPAHPEIRFNDLWCLKRKTTVAKFNPAHPVIRFNDIWCLKRKTTNVTKANFRVVALENVNVRVVAPKNR